MATCFVIQGFGKKTDFTDGRVLDLDASYAVIKEAVQTAGLNCIRADEITHAGTIDVPMYQYLLQADLVIADLSTYNVNAAFELGVRYGLRDRATIIVAEEQFKNPFDVGHIVIRRYKHLGEDIGAKEAKRFRDDLAQAVADIMAGSQADSPVYTFLQGVISPPRHQLAVAQPPAAPPLADPTIVKVANAPGVSPVRPAPSPAATISAPMPTPKVSVANLVKQLTAATVTSSAANDAADPFADELRKAAAAVGVTAKSLLDDALACIERSEFAAARDLLTEVRQIRPNDSFVIQQLALATYKSQQPTVEAALLAAKALLGELKPATTNDPETLGLWGAIHKRLWDLRHLEADLDESIAVCERGFSLKQDTYNGINLAHLLDMRALKSFKAGDRENGLADAVLAKRTRRQVIRYALPLLDKEMNAEKRFWILATLREAHTGLGENTTATEWFTQAQTLKVPTWMLESCESQITALRAMQSELAQFMDTV